MYFHEKKQNLLEVSEDYAIAHCVSADFALGAGVAMQIEDEFHIKDYLIRKYGATSSSQMPFCARAGSVLNLVTKEKYWHKPTLYALQIALLDMKDQIKDSGIDKVAMPRIGCGLDKLKWADVKPIIKDVFEDTDVEILVCYQ